ncbi:hypothetical protein JL722_513 [Aureococcus anophagefferens]|nr:hypothetical protein JL722_513 [Aureococcus anophagefferens]
MPSSSPTTASPSYAPTTAAPSATAARRPSRPCAAGPARERVHGAADDRGPERGPVVSADAGAHEPAALRRGHRVVLPVRITGGLANVTAALVTPPTAKTLVRVLSVVDDEAATLFADLRGATQPRTPAPSAAPCADSELDLRRQRRQDCAWVAEKPDARCAKVGGDGETAADACCACEEAAPSAAPTAYSSYAERRLDETYSYSYEAPDAFLSFNFTADGGGDSDFLAAGDVVDAFVADAVNASDFGVLDAVFKSYAADLPVAVDILRFDAAWLRGATSVANYTYPSSPRKRRKDKTFELWVKRAFRKVRRKRDSTLFYILYPFICCFCCGCCLTPLAIARRRPAAAAAAGVERPPPPVVAPAVVERPAAVEAPAADDRADVADLRDGRRPSTPPRSRRGEARSSGRRRRPGGLPEADDGRRRAGADLRRREVALGRRGREPEIADAPLRPPPPRRRREPGAAAFATPVADLSAAGPAEAGKPQRDARVAARSAHAQPPSSRGAHRRRARRRGGDAPRARHDLDGDEAVARLEPREERVAVVAVELEQHDARAVEEAREFVGDAGDAGLAVDDDHVEAAAVRRFERLHRVARDGRAGVVAGDEAAGFSGSPASSKKPQDFPSLSKGQPNCSLLLPPRSVCRCAL